jgi:hypothetical protein
MSLVGTWVIFAFQLRPLGQNISTELSALFLISTLSRPSLLTGYQTEMLHWSELTIANGEPAILDRNTNPIVPNTDPAGGYGAYSAFRLNQIHDKGILNSDSFVYFALESFYNQNCLKQVQNDNGELVWRQKSLWILCRLIGRPHPPLFAHGDGSVPWQWTGTWTAVVWGQGEVSVGSD